MTTATYSFTLDQLEATVREIAAEQPDFIYQLPDEFGICYYVHYSTTGEAIPGCIFGHALNRLGVPLKQLSSNGSISWALKQLGIIAEESPSDPAVRRQVDWMVEVQRKQDRSDTWAESVRQADVLHPASGQEQPA